MAEEKRKTLLVVGAGDLGRAVIQELCQSRTPLRIIASSRHPEKLDRFLNLLRLSAAARGFGVELDSLMLDLDDPADSAAQIATLAPDFVLMTATRQTWWLPLLLPDPIRRRLATAGYGCWLPIHLELTRRLMEILRDVQFSGRTITASYPDVINCLLARQGLVPFCGIGNIAEIVAQIRLSAAQHFAVALREVQVRMVGHHALQVAAASDKNSPLPPYHLAIEVAGFGKVEAELAEHFLRTPDGIPPGPATHSLTAACAAELFDALLSNESRTLHVPGPSGLPGGYPVDIHGAQLSLHSFAGLSPEKMIATNEASHRFDGIESISEDGTVTFRSESVEMMDAVLGYRCPRLEPDAVGYRAEELIDRFSRLARKHGVDLDKMSEIQVK